MFDSLRNEKGQFQTIHGHCKNGKETKTYKIWVSIRQRCNNPKNKYYKDYGSRGISVCEKWSKFENFIEDMRKCPEGLMMDRIDNNGNYEPDNCRWIDAKTSARNRRSTKLSTEKANEIRKLYCWGFKQYEIAKHFNVCQQMVSYVVNNKNWN